VASAGTAESPVEVEFESHLGYATVQLSSDRTQEVANEITFTVPG
jgi:hypothetical protein